MMGNWSNSMIPSPKATPAEEPPKIEKAEKQAKVERVEKEGQVEKVLKSVGMDQTNVRASGRIRKKKEIFDL